MAHSLHGMAMMKNLSQDEKSPSHLVLPRENFPA